MILVLIKIFLISIFQQALHNAFEVNYHLASTASKQCGSPIFEENDHVIRNETTPDYIFALENYNPILEFDLFPNPVQNLLNLNFKNIQNKEISLTLYNTLGQSVFSKQLNLNVENTISLDLLDIAKGMYFLHLQNEGKSVVRSVVKN
jgi:hypothetical protein